MNRLSAATPCLLLLAGCVSSARVSSAEGPGHEREALLARDHAMFEAEAASDRPLEAFLEFCLDDARLLAPESPMVSGKQEMRAAMAPLYELPDFSLAWSPVTADVGGGGDLGYTVGTYRMEYRDSEGALVGVDGKYLTIWKKVDGLWMVAADMFNANQPPEEP